MAIESIVVAKAGPIAAKAGQRAASYVGKVALGKIRKQALLDSAEALIDRATFAAFVDRLTPQQGNDYLAFLESPQFEHLALSVTTWHLAGRSADVLADLRETVRLSLRGRAGLAGEQLLTGTDLVMHLLTVAAESAIRTHVTIDNSFAIGVVAEVAAATARHHELLERLPDLRAVDRFAKQLRSQVAATKGKMRLAHLGRRAGVEYPDLHVDPTFIFTHGYDNRSTAEMLDQFQRVVVLGDPGAGKSTLAGKIAYDLARDALPGREGRVPFLIIAREYAEALRTTRRPLAALLADVANDPYNLTPPADAIEQLLLDGSAFIVIDGIDELGDAEARRRLAALVEAFAHRYPLVNMLITSRSVGYDEAALDSDQFAVVRIAPFTDEQVADYAGRWFALEDEQSELATSFLGESDNLGDLRSNPLVLSLLCSLYETKHYIPVNRAQIYENCAELLFERWDHGRGMTVPMRFGTHMRPAVARLAWVMFTDPSAGQVFGRDRVAELLIEYMLEERFDDWTEAAQAATQFLDYCAGRAWLLTEMGVRHGQRLYGFTHRTFLEYFTAVHLVRLGPSPEQVWDRLAHRIPDASWNTVAMLAVHRLERDCDGGASRLLELLLDTAEKAPHRGAYLQFGAEIAAQIGLRSGPLRRLALECVRLCGSLPSRQRYRLDWPLNIDELLIDHDGPLKSLLDVELPENSARLVSAVLDAFHDPRFDLGDENLSFGLVVAQLANPEERPFPRLVRRGVAQEFERLVRVPVQIWVERLRARSPEIIRRDGADALFKQSGFASSGITTGAWRMLCESITTNEPNPQRIDELGRIYAALVESPWPWIRVDGPAIDSREWIPALDFRDMQDILDPLRLLALSPAQRSSALLLLLVLMEDVTGRVPERVLPFVTLWAARFRGAGRPAAIEQVRSWGLLPEAYDLVVSWINDEASPVARNRPSQGSSTTGDPSDVSQPDGGV